MKKCLEQSLLYSALYFAITVILGHIPSKEVNVTKFENFPLDLQLVLDDPTNGNWFEWR